LRFGDGHPSPSPNQVDDLQNESNRTTTQMLLNDSPAVRVPIPVVNGRQADPRHYDLVRQVEGRATSNPTYARRS
jgi:hypothetical protein